MNLSADPFLADKFDHWLEEVFEESPLTGIRRLVRKEMRKEEDKKDESKEKGDLI